MNVSVIIPAWNAESTIRRALESVARQAVKPDEVLVVDDASSDATAACAEAALEEFQLPGRVVQRTHSRREFAGAARNEGVARSSGEILSFLDSDDAWLPDHLEKGLKVFEEHSDVVAYSSRAQTLGAEGELLGVMPGENYPETGKLNLFEFVVERMRIPNVTLMVRRELFAAAGGYHPELRCYEDWWLCIHLARLGPWYLSSEITCDVFVQPSSLSQTRSGKKKEVKVMSIPMYLDRVRLVRELEQQGEVSSTVIAEMKRESWKMMQLGLIESARLRELRRFLKLSLGLAVRDPFAAVKVFGTTGLSLVKIGLKRS